MPRLSALAALLCLLMFAAPASAKAPWEKIDTSDGITVYTRAVQGQNLPEFKGVAVLHADAFELLGIIHDVPKHCRWRAKCHSARLIDNMNDFERVLYTRIDAPWPVSDRDVVLHGKATVNPAKKIVISRFHSVRHPKAPPVSGVVRMPKLRGFYKMQILGPKRVRVTYQVYSDPGGLLPGWLAARTAKKLPYKTLMGLRSRHAKTRGQYAWVKKKYDPSAGGTVPAKYLVGAPAPKPAPAPAPAPAPSARPAP